MRPVASIEYDLEPAPGRLELVRRFANTVDPEHRREVLHAPSQLHDLLVSLGLLDAGTPVTAADLKQAHHLRDQIRALALANNGVPTDASLDAHVLVRVHDTGGELTAARDVDGAFAALVGIVYTAMADGSWRRLKACRREVCHWLFYDRSRNRSGVWCSMAVCGNRTKTRAYRERAATRS